MSNGESLAPQEISMLFAVLPRAVCQGFFHQIHRMFTFAPLWRGGSRLI
jgi:hypothetical protein